MSSFVAVASASEAREHDPERGGMEIHVAFGAAFGRREAVWKVTKSSNNHSLQRGAGGGI